MGLRWLKLMLTWAQMSATFQSRCKNPLLIAPSLNWFRFQKKKSGFRTLEAVKLAGDWGGKARGTRATINLDLACILLFRTLYKDIILTLSIL